MKYVYFFGAGKAEGSTKDTNLLGGKGANLAEMTKMGIPVPPGLTITTDVCNYFIDSGLYPDELKSQTIKSLTSIESVMKQRFDSPENPLLVSIRSGARQSMPGMMETVLNVGLTNKTIPGLINQSGDERFVYDAYRRLIMMYADVVMEKSLDIVPGENEGIREQLELIMKQMKSDKGVLNDYDLTAHDLRLLSEKFKLKIKDLFNKEFPDDSQEQLWGSISAVFNSWNGKRAVSYRKIEKIPGSWGTAVNVQAMVFGNMGEKSATGVAFTRNPATGENVFFGEWLLNAQGEDVVAGIRTPNPINNKMDLNNSNNLTSLETCMPIIYKQLNIIQKKLELRYKDMQDIEFTIQDGKLWILQTRTGKRNGSAAIRMAVEMLNSRLIKEKDVLLRIKPAFLAEIMHPMVDQKSEKNAVLLGGGLPAGPGGATGQIVFTANDAEEWKENGKKVILVRTETSPEDVHGMHAAEAILTSRGGMTSHAALVARGWGRCCVVGCSGLNINLKTRSLTLNNTTLKEGDWVTLNGTTGKIYAGKLPLIDVNLNDNPYFIDLMGLIDKHRNLGVRTNADSPKDAKIARNFGAQGIGLCRTEHMFFHPDRIRAMQEMILAENKDDRILAINKLLPFQQKDFYGILRAMEPHPVTVRLLDPPLHEFLPTDGKQAERLASKLGLPIVLLKKRIQSLHESNPMLGHRGCRLGIAYPEITSMQARAIFNATVQLLKEGFHPNPEIMVPLVGSIGEFVHQKILITNAAKAVKKETTTEFNFLVGTMIELPRACLIADLIALEADFFSFGTNDLTQTTFGFSRDDIGSFLPKYLEDNVLTKDPFQSIDREGVGELVKIAVSKARNANESIKLGICGEHGGDPDSIAFFNTLNLDYVSCSPYRVPIARLAAAQSTL